MSAKTDTSAGNRKNTIVEAVIQAARKAGASEALAVCFVKYLMEDSRIRIVVKQEAKEGREKDG